MKPIQVTTAADFVRIEAAELSALAERLAGPMKTAFDKAAALLAACPAERRRVIVTGMGKSGLIAQKIAATLNSTALPAQYLHPAEAIHGDLGMAASGDVILALSYSGETDELVALLEAFDRTGCTLISLCGDPSSTLAAASSVALNCSISQEACSLGLAPTASTTVMLALGDALAMEASRLRNFRAEDFAQLHPGGGLGRRLQCVGQLMHAGDAIPVVAPDTPMPEVIHEMSRKRLGITTVAVNGKLLGVISDGDLRRLLEREGGHALELTAEKVMHVTPLTISAAALGSVALSLMEERKVTALVVTGEDQSIEGVVHLHDLWKQELG